MNPTEPSMSTRTAPGSPADRVSTPVDGVAVLGSLSPSRAGDFLTCPLLYRYRTIDRLEEPLSLDALRGTLVHKVLEDLFDLPALDRTPDRAQELLVPAWEALCAAEPELAEAFSPDPAEPKRPTFERWLSGCRATLERYFTLEDPRRIEPAEREVYVETILESKLLLRGFIDRVDVAPTGEVRIVDYKTGRAPGIGFEHKALFQLRIYALAIWRERGVLPTLLQLTYLGNGELVTYRPDQADLEATERKINAIWSAIRVAEETGDWRARRSGLCGWCSHQALCPEFGGTPPPLPEGRAPLPLSVQRASSGGSSLGGAAVTAPSDSASTTS